MRKTVWKQKALQQATKALFFAKYVLKNQDLGDQRTSSNLETASEDKNS